MGCLYEFQQISAKFAGFFNLIMCMYDLLSDIYSIMYKNV